MIAPNFFRLTSRLIALLGIGATAAWAQVGAPVLGLLPDRGLIHPVNGIPASASIAPALDFGARFLQIAIAPRQDFALVSTAGSGVVALAYPNGTTASVPGLPAYPDAIALSPLGSAAVLWFASPRLLEIVSGLPGSPVVRQVNPTFLSGEDAADVPAVGARRQRRRRLGRGRMALRSVGVRSERRSEELARGGSRLGAGILSEQ